MGQAGLQGWKEGCRHCLSSPLHSPRNLLPFPWESGSTTTLSQTQRPTQDGHRPAQGIRRGRLTAGWCSLTTWAEGREGPFPWGKLIPLCVLPLPLHAIQASHLCLFLISPCGSRRGPKRHQYQGFVPFTPAQVPWLQGSLPWGSNPKTVPSQGVKATSPQLPSKPNSVLCQESLLGWT